MSGALLSLLPAALGVAISPIPIIAVILMVMSKRARQNGPAFVVGWAAALIAVVGIIIWLAATGNISVGENGPSTASSVIILILSLVLLILAAQTWLTRPRKSQKPVAPMWMAALDRFSVGKSLGLGAISASSTKNLCLSLIAGFTISQAGVGRGQQRAMALSFALVGSITVLSPVVFALTTPKEYVHSLNIDKAWLIRNNQMLVSLSMLVIGGFYTLRAVIELV